MSRPNLARRDSPKRLYRTAIFILALVVLAGCGGNTVDPTAMAASEIESHIEKELSLQSVSLTPDPGGFEGSAVTSDGSEKAVRVIVNRKIKWLDFELLQANEVIDSGFINAD